MSSRRDAITMTMDEIRVYLKEQGRLILTSNGATGYPHPMPMNFFYDDNDTYLVTTFAKSQKVKNIQRDPRCALLVESGEAYSELKSVLAYADAEIIDDHATVEQTMIALGGKELGHPELPEAAKEQIRASVPKRVVLRFRASEYVSWDHSKLHGKY